MNNIFNKINFYSISNKYELNNNNSKTNKNTTNPKANKNKIICIKDLDINENTKRFSYRDKTYYLYTPKNQLKNSNIIPWRCIIYR